MNEWEEGDDVGIDAGPWTSAGAVFSPNRKYRYRLWREWDEALPRVVFVMLNPSVADEDHLDPTLRRCIGYARRWGCGSMDVVNAFAYVDGDPNVMLHQENPVGTENDRYILEAVAGAGIVVAAWSYIAQHRGRAAQLQAMLVRAGVQLQCLGITIDGSPKHPLRLPYTATLQPYPRSAT